MFPPPKPRLPRAIFNLLLTLGLLSVATASAETSLAPDSTSDAVTTRATALPTATTHATAGWVRWNPASDRVVSLPAHRSPGYPRASRLSNGDILLGYHHGAALGAFGAYVALRKSHDGGRTWAWSRDIEGPEGNRFWGFSNLSFVELGTSGRLLLVTAGRGRAEPGCADIFASECARSELRLRFSEDFGETWGLPRAVAAGIGRVWEPSLVRLADGELQLFYANEATDLATKGGAVQRIEMIASHDEGQTWSEPVAVSRSHPGCRPGMPAAAVLADGETVVCAQEMVHDSRSPWVTPVRRRRPAKDFLAQSRRGFGSAPFLLRAPDGGMLLAIHSAAGRSAPRPEDMEMSWMFENIWVQRADAAGREFGAGTRPWPETDGARGAFFPGLMVRDERTLVALGTFITRAADGSCDTVVRWVEGTLATPSAAVPADGSDRRISDAAR